MLSGDEIEATLDAVSVSGLAGARVKDRARIRRQVAAGDCSEFHDEVGATAVRSFLEAAGVCWNESFRARLGAIQLEILTPDIFHACAMLGENGPKVIIYRGFLKALAFFLELISTESAIDRSLRRRFWAYKSRGLSKRSKFFSKFPLIFYVAGRDDCLPRPNSALTRDHQADLFTKFAVCLSFIVMHELGHIEFGHLSPNAEGALVTPPLLVAPEEINQRKLEEFEADSFVLEGIAPEWSFFARGQCAGVLGFLAFVEGRLAQSSSTHPMSINRLHHALNSFLPEAGDPSPSYAGMFNQVVGSLSGVTKRLATARAAAPTEPLDWEFLDSANEVSGMSIEILQRLYRRWAFSEGASVNVEHDAQAAEWSRWMAHLFAPGPVSDGASPASA